MPATLFDPGETLAVAESRGPKKRRPPIDLRDEAHITRRNKGKLWEEQEAAIEALHDHRSEAEHAALAAGYDRLRFDGRGQGLAHLTTCCCSCGQLLLSKRHREEKTCGPFQDADGLPACVYYRLPVGERELPHCRRCWYRRCRSRGVRGAVCGEGAAGCDDEVPAVPRGGRPHPPG
jgi:hypothetical protein